jgi:DNA-binding NarL/FixJ family response regulator
MHFLVLTVYEDSDKIFQALAAGASGYLLKRVQPTKLLEAIREVREGGSPMSSSIARQVVQSFHRMGEAKKESENLSSRELEILQLLTDGYLYKEIADKLNIGRETVRTYVRRIYEKLHVRTRTEAVVKHLRQ